VPGGHHLCSQSAQRTARPACRSRARW
jgi:hypothetical protein